MERFCKRYVLKVMSLVIVLITILFTLQVFPQESQVLSAESITIDDGPSGAKIVDIKLGATNSPAYYALTDDGYVYAWGSCSDGQLGNGEASNSTVNIPQKVSNARNLQSQGEYLSEVDRIFVFSESNSSSVFAIKKNGDLYAWGNNIYGRLGFSWGKIIIQHLQKFL